MLADPAQVGLRVWFVPEDGIDESSAKVLGTVVGVRAAVQLAQQHVRELRASEGCDSGYDEMYEFAEKRLEEYCANAQAQWSCSVPVNYGTILIA